MTPTVLLEIFADSLKSIRELLVDVPDERAAEQPAGLPNHPAWTLTHLCVANDYVLHLLGRRSEGHPNWAELAAPGSRPTASRGDYPKVADLLDTLDRQHAAMTQAVRSAPAGHFEQPSPESIRSFAPTIGHMLAYMLTAHEQNHLGQLQAWKRAAGLMPK